MTVAEALAESVPIAVEGGLWWAQLVPPLMLTRGDPSATPGLYFVRADQSVRAVYTEAIRDCESIEDVPADLLIELFQQAR